MLRRYDPDVVSIKNFKIFSALLVAQAVASAAVDQAPTSLRITVAPGCQGTVISLLPGLSGPPGQTSKQTLTFTYKIRTSPAGQGQITVRFTAAQSYPNGSKIDYKTTLSGVGTALSGTIGTNAAVASGIPIVRFGGQVHTPISGITGKVEYTVNPSPPSTFGPLTPSLTVTCQ